MFRELTHKLEQKFDAPDDAQLANFRVLTEEGYTPCSVKEMTSSSLVIYAMTSIFSSVFMKDKPVLHMMQESDHVFAQDAKIAPIFYINSRKLQEVTEESMFGRKKSEKTTKKKSGPLFNAEKRWLTTFQKAEAQQQQAGINVNRFILEWEELIAQNTYPLIHNFIRSILVQEEPSKFMSSDTLLSEAIQQQALLGKVKEVVTIFVSHNVRTFKRKTVNAENPLGIPAEDELALREYLAQEFSVFLCLAYLNTYPMVQTAYASSGVSISTPGSVISDTSIQPVLIYPISDSADGLAEKTLRLFLQIQDIYIQHCQQLALPNLQQPLLVVDSLIPENIKKLKIKSDVAMPLTADEKKDCSESRDSVSGSLDLLSHQPQNGYFIHRNPSAFHSHSTVDVETVAKKIFLSLEQHVELGVREAEVIYQNGVTCDAIVSKTNEPSIDKESVQKIIKLSVGNVLSDNREERCAFVYRGHLWRLTTKLTLPSINSNFAANVLNYSKF